MDEYFIQTFSFGDLAHQHGTGNDEGLSYIGRDFCLAFGGRLFQDFGGLTDVFDATVGARTDKDFVNRYVRQLGAGSQANVFQGALLGGR